jgi:hypothetical protein
MHKANFLVVFILAMLAMNANLHANPGSSDSSFVFKSPRPLINPNEIDGDFSKAFGFDLLFSNSGFGMGMFYHVKLQEDLFFNGSFFISGFRDDDEFEKWDIPRQEYRVPNKVNRIYQMPVTFGIQKFFLKGILVETLRPFASIGVGASLITTTPYNQEFFHSFRYMRAYFRFASFVAIGTNFGDPDKSLMGVSIKYYFIPFGGKGIESIKDQPITDFGGVYISLNFGKTF